MPFCLCQKKREDPLASEENLPQKDPLSSQSTNFPPSYPSLSLSLMDFSRPSSFQNPNPTMTSHFMKSLENIITNPSSTTTTSFSGRSRRIKHAAYVSMAVAAGSGMIWSRALLRRLRGCRLRNLKIVAIQRRARVSRSRVSWVESLQRVVPGGESMGLCCLLEETASYVQCLRDQVTLMQSILDSASCN